MLKNYINVAVRNILRNKAFSFINIFGLSVAMSVCMAIIMLVADQMMNDRHNPNKERIYRVNSIPYFNGRKEHRGNEAATTTLPVRDELLNNYTGVEKAVRLVRGFGNMWLEFEPGYDINIPVSGFFADPEVLEMFDHELLYGDAKTALVEPYSVVLTKQAAEKLFDVENPVGESIKVGELGTYKVTGVIKSTENKSHIVAEAFASIATVKSLSAAKVLDKDLDNWYTFTSGYVYIMLEEGKKVEAIESHLAQIHKDHFTELPTPESSAVIYNLQPLMKITPGELINNPIGPFMPWIIIYFISALAGVVLITSCFNFTNLSIAKSLSRAKEIGVRKVTGAQRTQIFTQFISEAVIISLFALVLSFGFLAVLKPLMSELAFTKVMRWDLSANYFVYAVFFVLAIVVGIFAGLFPAVVLSGFQPINVLKNMNNSKLMSRMGLRKALLVIQFTFSMIFILTVIVLYNQLNLFLHSDYGFDAKNKIIVQKGTASHEVLKTELLKQKNVTSVSFSSHLPSAGIVYGNGFKKSLEENRWTNLNYFSVDEDYLRNMSIPLIAGEFFSGSLGASNKNNIVINETALKELQFATPYDAIGQVVIYQRDSTEKKIIGVVKDYVHELASETLSPLALMYNPDEFRIAQIGYTGDFKNASSEVTIAWATVYPNLKADIKDFEREMKEMYEILFGTLVKVLGFIATLAIIISCLGLLGMATYTIETRRKEIAVRKVLGSSNKSLVYVLSKGYIIILLMAIMFSVPIAYFMNTLWLEQFAIHTTVDIATISFGVLILAVFGIFTVGSQTIQAIFVNPVENLKSE